MTAKDDLTFYNRSLERALQILCAFSVETQHFSLGQLSQAVHLAKPTVFRLCSTLTKYDFLSYDFAAKQYSLGLKLFELGGIVFASLSLRKIASSHLDQLKAGLGKTTFLGILRDDELVYIDKKEDIRNPIRFASHIGRRRPPYFGMLGQVLMAYLPESEVDRLLGIYPLTAFTSKSITDPKVFKKKLKKIREHGYFVDEEEAIEGITGVAAPLRDFTGNVVAAIGASFISSSVDGKGVRKIQSEVLKTAQAISQELGHLEKTQHADVATLR
jgi:IclR family transcriptional regulator, KDG regulon repressor